MTSVDLRTRTAGTLRSVDARWFFEDLLVERCDEQAALVAPGAQQLDLRPFGVEVDGSGWTLAFDGEVVQVAKGTAGAHAVVRLDAEGLTDLVHDVRTPVGFFVGGDLDMPVGRLDDFLDWWVVIRSLVDGRRAHVAGDVTFRDRVGGPLDLARGFERDSDPQEQAHFLAEAGYLHLRRVFEQDEMAAISADMDALAGTYSNGDGRSWWARTSDGTERLVRMQHFQAASSATAALLLDDRLARLGRLFDDGHRLGKPGSDGNLVEALVKPIGVTEGISDVPWHKDCSLGGHALRCCSMTVGVSVTGADHESGQLRVVAGSHRALTRPALLRRPPDDLPQVDLPTETGDVTVHLSCTLHMAQPPASRERRVLYLDLSLPTRDGERHEDSEATLRRIRKRAGREVSQEPSPVRT